jgi:membrane-bound ClpP family serine protease
VKTLSVVGIALIVLGLVSFSYQGITYTTHKKVLAVGPLHATTEQHETIPLPPILGAAAFVGGVVLLLAGNRMD